jgi:hypothetical protein
MYDRDLRFAPNPIEVERVESRPQNNSAAPKSRARSS